MGIPLYNIPEIRAMYGKGPGNSPIDFLKEEYIYPDRHVIAARITAGNTHITSSHEHYQLMLPSVHFPIHHQTNQTNHYYSHFTYIPHQLYYHLFREPR